MRVNAVPAEGADAVSPAHVLALLSGPPEVIAVTRWAGWACPSRADAGGRAPGGQVATRPGIGDRGAPSTRAGSASRTFTSVAA